MPELSEGTIIFPDTSFINVCNEAIKNNPVSYFHLLMRYRKFCWLTDSYASMFPDLFIDCCFARIIIDWHNTSSSDDGFHCAAYHHHDTRSGKVND